MLMAREEASNKEGEEEEVEASGCLRNGRVTKCS